MKIDYLKRGDEVAIIAPASPYLKNQYDDIKKNIELLGLKPVFLDTCYKEHGHFAGTTEERVHDIHEAFQNPRYKGIVCLKGGYGTPRLLKHLDMKLIKENYKLFMGYSDITALHILFNNNVLPTFHGPMASSPFTDDYTMDYMKKALFSDELYEIKNPVDEKLDILVQGKCSGELVGGNLSLLISTLGSPYEIDTKGKILFIEEVNEPNYVIDRMLNTLDLAGKFNDCVGIVLGSFTGCDSDPDNTLKTDLNLKTIIEEIILPYNKPTVSNFRAGHNFPQPTLPFGVKVEMNTENKSIQPLESKKRSL